MSATVFQIYPLSHVVKKDVPEGMRLARLIRKGDKESTGVHVPVLRINEILEAIKASTVLQDAVIETFEGWQNGQIKAIEDESKRSPCAVDLTFESLADWYERTQESEGRLQKKDIEVFFSTKLQASLLVAFAEKLGIEENDAEGLAKITAIVKGYGEKLASLSGPVQYGQEDCRKLLKALALVSPDTAGIHARLERKLHRMLKKGEEALEGL